MDEDSAVTHRVLQKADKILASADEAYIITNRNHVPRSMPTFRPEEISLGKILGTGGFGIVNEITKFTLDPVESSPENPAAHPVEEAGVSEGDGCRRRDDDGDDKDNYPVGRDGGAITDLAALSPNDTHVHYDVGNARHLMENRCQRNGVPRYALKRLHNNLSSVERARGMVDLAVESKYLSVVWHPNISK
jgi:hypothetical protein